MTTKIIPLANKDAWVIHAGTQDVYQSWEYAYAIAAGLDELYTPQLLVGEVCGCSFVFPFVPETRNGLLQASSLYGYPGIAFEGDPVRALDVREYIKAALSEAGFVKAFIRWGVEARTGKLFNGDEDFSVPIRRVPLMSNTDPTIDGTGAVIGSTGLEFVFGGGDCSTHRSQVARGKKAGLVAVVQAAPDYVDMMKFRDQYVRTMDRVGAEEKYFFSEEYFARLAALGDKVAMIRTEQSRALFLVGHKMAYYHLSAREARAHNTEIHLIFDAAAKWAMDQGLTDIVLGGGKTGAEDDSLYLFKSRIGRCLDKAEFTEIICDKEKCQ